MYFKIAFINFFARKDKWKNFLSFQKSLSKNKHLEIETFYSNYHFFNFEFDIQPYGKDHAGARLMINLLGWELEIHFYDNRHWDYQNWCWEKREQK